MSQSCEWSGNRKVSQRAMRFQCGSKWLATQIYIRGAAVSHAHTIVRVRVYCVCQEIHTYTTTVVTPRTHNAARRWPINTAGATTYTTTTVLSHQFGRKSITMPCFCHSSKGSSFVLQDQARGWPRWCLHNEKWVCLETLSLGIARKSVMCEQLHRTWLCMLMINMEAPLCRQAVFKFQIPSGVSCASVSIKGKGHPCTGTEALYRPYGP